VLLPNIHWPDLGRKILLDGAWKGTELQQLLLRGADILDSWTVIFGMGFGVMETLSLVLMYGLWTAMIVSYKFCYD
jgi:hypothetical protein